MRTAALSVLVVGLSMGVAAGGAHAQFVTFGFTDLEGSFNRRGFSAVSVDAAPLHSAGDVSLVGLTGGTADYDAGFESLGTNAEAFFGMSVFNITATTADATGGFQIWDADLDSIDASFTGVWTNRGNGFAYFDGTVTHAWFEGAGNGSFDGPSGGSFSLDGLVGTHWTGGAISFLMPIPDGFFTTYFDGNVTLVDGIIAVPAPAGVALLALGRLVGVATRHRR